jgi:hypothetical protein
MSVGTQRGSEQWRSAPPASSLVCIYRNGANAGILRTTARHRKETGVQGRNSYAIKIRTQQQKQEQFAFSEFEVHSQLTREPQRNHTQFEFQPVKVRPQQSCQRKQQVQNDISEVETLSNVRTKQPQRDFTQSTFAVDG